MILEKLPAVQALSLDEKELLAEEIWQEVSAERDTLPIPQEHLKILEQRRTEFEANPEKVRSWDEVKKGIQGKFGISS